MPLSLVAFFARRSVFDRTFDAPIFQPSFDPQTSSTNFTVTPDLQLPPSHSQIPYYNRPSVRVSGVDCCLGVPGLNAVCVHPLSHTVMSSLCFDLLRLEGRGEEEEAEARANFAKFLDGARGR